MDILVPDNWLRDFLKTSATPKQIMELLSLCGPSVEKLEKTKYGVVYSIEVTTNRVDAAGIDGIAREASAILARFGIKAKFIPPKPTATPKLAKEVKYLKTKVDYSLCPRFTAILLKNVKVKPSPKWMQERLLAVGVRPINNLVDITNYIMHELGQPMHIFDYDKISGQTMILRKSRKGEKITTLDGKTYTLPGNDIVIEDGEGRLIDLAGIMGGANSAVSEKTTNALLFIQVYNPTIIRQTSMQLAARTEASSLFEKGLDPEKVETALKRGIDLAKKLANAQPVSTAVNIYPNPYKGKNVVTSLQFIESRIGIKIKRQEITKILASLGFVPKWRGDELEVQIPSWRARDVNAGEDIVEEVARLYGYFNLPSYLPEGKLPENYPDASFKFEAQLRQYLRGWGGIEIYTLSMVAKDKVAFEEKTALRLKNPLGTESEYLRVSLGPSLIQAALANKNIREEFHLFELGNVYIPKQGQLPQEKMMLAGVFANYNYRKAKGIIENLLEALRVKAEMEPKERQGFLKYHSLAIKAGKIIGWLGMVEKKLIYYEFDIESLRKASKPNPTYKPIPKYPPQIEDLSLIIPPKTYIGNVVKQIYNTDKRIKNVSLIDIYQNTYTFRIFYQSSHSNLTDKQVEKIRNKVLSRLRSLKIKVKG